MIFHGVVYYHCDIEVVVQSVPTQSRDLVSNVVANRDAIEVVRWQVSVAFVSFYHSGR